MASGGGGVPATRPSPRHETAAAARAAAMAAAAASTPARARERERGRADAYQSPACSVDWFVSLLVREKVLLAGLCERKILFQLKNLRSFTISHSQTNWP